MRAQTHPPRGPPSTGRNGGTGQTGTRPLPSPSWGHERSSRGEPARTIGKDVTADVAEPVAIVPVVADTRHADDADNAPPGPARSVTLDGTRTNRSAGATTRTERRTPRSSRVADIAGAENLGDLWLGAGPRAPREPGLAPRPRSQPRAVRAAQSGESAADIAELVLGGGACPPRWPARSGSLAGVANAGLPDGKRHCSNDSEVAPAERTARTL
jgi:hypothetical protein